METRTAAAAVRRRIEDGVDAQALAAWMERHVKGFVGPLEVSRFQGGQSNPTYRLTTPERAYVMRRKPSGQLLKGAHAIEREALVIAAVGEAGFPVPKVFSLCEDVAVIGTAFYIMELVEGRIFWDGRLPEIAREDRPLYYEAMNATLAQLHAIDPVAAGLADFGRAGNYLERQIARWTRQYLSDEAAGRDPSLDRLIEWLPRHIPPEGPGTIVHGDFRIDNMIFHPTEPRVIAVLDWELSTLGDPIADFTYHAMVYRLPPHILAGLAAADFAALNIPSETDYVAAYCRRTGRARIDGYEYYMAYNLFRLAAIYHGIKGRVLRGTAASSEARVRAAQLPEIAALALESARKIGA